MNTNTLWILWWLHSTSLWCHTPHSGHWWSYTSEGKHWLNQRSDTSSSRYFWLSSTCTMRRLHIHVHTHTVYYTSPCSRVLALMKGGEGGLDELPVCALVSSLHWVDRGFILGWGLPVNQPLLPFATLQLCPRSPDWMRQAAYSVHINKSFSIKD